MRDNTDLLKEELFRAKIKHPFFPHKDVIHMLSILGEESGEAIRAANQYMWEEGTIIKLWTELEHTGAMVLRCMENIQKLYIEELNLAEEDPKITDINSIKKVD